MDRDINVIIVDDSAIYRKLLARELSRERGIKVIGEAPDPYAARDKIRSLKPNVIILDIIMPRMDGLTYLKEIMQHYPLPVIIFSSFTPEGGRIAIEALSLGAFDVVSKPTLSDSARDMGIRLAEKIRVAARVKVQNCLVQTNLPDIEKLHLQAPALLSDKIIAIGASTGGTEAIKTVLAGMPSNSPAILIVQHMPRQLTASFAQRLNALCDMQVKEAENNDSVLTGKVLVAPGGFHMLLRKGAAGYFVEVKRGPQVNYQRPSANVLFQSVADYAGRNAVGIILTGMGADGAEGLLKMKHKGAKTIAQDNQSCVVFGMPKAAIKLGAAEKVISLPLIAKSALDLLM